MIVASEEAGCELLIAHATPAPAGSPVSVAIRPEKIALSKDPVAGGDGRNQTTGIVREIAYLGDVSIYLVQLPTGKTVRVTAPNVTRRTEMPITWEDEVTLTWRPFAGVVLTQ